MNEYWLDADLQRLPVVRQLEGRVFASDSGANKIGVRVTDGGQPVTLSGSVSANIVRPDGTTISVSGSKSGNTAWVILPDAAYSARGKIGVFLKLTSGSVVTTLGGLEAYVY